MPSSHPNKPPPLPRSSSCAPEERSRKRSKRDSRVAVGLTCLQVLFAVYATSLLCYMNLRYNLRTEFGASPQHHHHNRAFQETGCIAEEISFEQKVCNDTKLLSLKAELYREVLLFQKRTRGCETLQELLSLPTQDFPLGPPKITVILNHFRRKTICTQIEALLAQTLPFYRLWVLAFNSPNEEMLRMAVQSYNDTRMSFVSSSYDFKYYGRFQLALQTQDSDYVYILDDDMIPGKKILQILAHAAGTSKYSNAALGSIGRILPFRQQDYSFPSYRKRGVKEAGLYLPDPAYNIIVEHALQVDFLSSSWFLPATLVKTLFMETPLTFATGEDLQLSYELQKYLGAGSYVIPTDPNDKDTWGDMDHRLAYVSETTAIHTDTVQVRDSQWWAAMSRGFITQWARMHPQQSDALFFAHSLKEVEDLRPLIQRFRSTSGKKAYIAVTGGQQCPCEEAAILLGWSRASCYDRRFRIFDLQVGLGSSTYNQMTLLRELLPAIKGLITIHSPAVLITVEDLHPAICHALTLATPQPSTTLIRLPRPSIPLCLWIVNIRPTALQRWNRMKVSINVVTQNRPASLQRLLKSIIAAHFIGDNITLTFSIDSGVDQVTLTTISTLDWPHGSKVVRRRIILGGLVRAVSESWYPSDDDDFGVILEDDTEVSPLFYIWLKYTLLVYHYSPHAPLPELVSIALYTPRVIEVASHRPKWNATNHFKGIHPNSPYLHQLPCSWGALFFPKHWREFYEYMAMRYTTDAKQNPVQIPHSRTNGWQNSWKKFLIDLMYLRGYVTLYPNFPTQASFSTNHMEPGTHIDAFKNMVTHKKEDFEVPLIREDFVMLLPDQKLPPMSKLPIINLFNQISSLKGLKVAGAKLGQDVLQCNSSQVVRVDKIGHPLQCLPI